MHQKELLVSFLFSLKTSSLTFWSLVRRSYKGYSVCLISCSSLWLGFFHWFVSPIFSCHSRVFPFSIFTYLFFDMFSFNSLLVQMFWSWKVSEDQGFTSEKRDLSSESIDQRIPHIIPHISSPWIPVAVTFTDSSSTYWLSNIIIRASSHTESLISFPSQVNVDWELSETICDFWIAFDVTLSTASILNLVAISIDR